MATSWHLLLGARDSPQMLQCPDTSISVYPHLRCCNSPWCMYPFPTSAASTSGLLGAPWSTGSSQGGDASSANEIPNPKLLCYSKPMKMSAASLRVRNSCLHRETSAAQHVSPGLPESKVLSALFS